MGRSGMFVRATGVLTSCALAALLLGAVDASARSQGFYIYNLTHQPMKLKEIEIKNDAKFDREANSPKPPKVGDVLMPGVDSGPKYDHNHVELERRLVAPFGIARLFYNNGQRDYGAWLDTGQRRPICEWFSPAPYCTTDAPYIYFLDEPGTVHEFPASEAQKHAEFVQQLCTDGNLNEEVVTCDFDLKEAPDRKAFGSPHLVGAVVPNCAEETGNPVIDSEHVIDVDHEQEDETAQENSFGVKITVEAQFGAFIEKLKTAIETSYKGTWSSSETFKDKVAYKVRPGEIGYTVGENPVIRVTGDLTLVIGNTTLILRDIYIDNPDKSRNNVQWRPIRKE